MISIQDAEGPEAAVRGRGRRRRRAVDRAGGPSQAAQCPVGAEHGGDRLPLCRLSLRGHGRPPGRLYRLAARTCRAENAEPATIIEPAAVELLAARLRTPLQIEQYLTRVFETTFEAGEKVVTATLAETVLSPRIDDLEPRLTRYGYDVKSIARRSTSSRPMCGCSCRASSIPPAPANSPNRCSSPAAGMSPKTPRFPARRSADRPSHTACAGADDLKSVSPSLRPGSRSVSPSAPG